MKRRIAVVGNTPLNLGVGAAADLALAGHAVSFADWAENTSVLADIGRKGGLYLAGDGTRCVSGKFGLAALAQATHSIEDAVRGAELIVMDAPWLKIESHFERMLPALRSEQVVHVNTHGYWPAFRVAKLLREAGKEGITITEGVDPPMSAGYAAGTVTPHCLKRNLSVSAFPASRNGEALTLLHSVFPTIVPAASVLHTNLHSTNLMGHPAVSLLNVAAFDQAGARGKGVLFYKEGSTRHTGILSDALDAERRLVCEAYGVPFQSLPDQFVALFGSAGSTFEAAIATTDWLQDLPELPSNVWERWMRADVPLLHAPFVALARNAGLEAPLFRSLVDIFGAIIGADFWASALTLEALGVGGRTPAQIMQYALEGR